MAFRDRGGEGRSELSLASQEGEAPVAVLLRDAISALARILDASTGVVESATVIGHA